MGKKKKNKNKKKKVNAKRERYAKFRKDKPSLTSFAAPTFTPEQQKQNQEDDRTISLFMRNSPKYPDREICERKEKSKR